MIAAAAATALFGSYYCEVSQRQDINNVVKRTRTERERERKMKSINNNNEENYYPLWSKWIECSGSFPISWSFILLSVCKT